MDRPFLIYALPRSRTFWLSQFLAYDAWICGHDEMRHARTLEDVRSWFSQPLAGSVETLAAPFWRVALGLRPDLRSIVIRRPVDEVITSLQRLGFAPDLIAPHMRKLDRKLDQIEARVPGVLSLTYADLATEAGCCAVFERALGRMFDRRWYEQMAPLNLQTDMSAMVRYAAAYKPQMDRLAAVSKQTVLTALQLRQAVPPAGVTFQLETVEQARADADDLIRQHLVEVGESPDAAKNVPLFRKLESNEALQIMTARSNGRMFGYLVTVVGESLETQGVLVGCHTTFFASPAIRGLGLKLQRAALAELHKRGVHEVFFRAGPRGAGARLGPLYRRLGAVEDGQQYRLYLSQER